MIATICLLILSLLTLGCATTHVGPPPADARIVSIKLSPWPLRAARVHTRNAAKQTTVHRVSSAALSEQLLAQRPQLDLQAAQFHRNSQRGFWLGLAGALLAAVADGQGYVPGRTAGNALWGIGWVSWLGFYGLAQAEFNDAVQDEQQLGWQREQRSSLDSGEPADGGQSRGWRFGWTVRSF